MQYVVISLRSVIRHQVNGAARSRNMAPSKFVNHVLKRWLDRMKATGDVEIDRGASKPVHFSIEDDVMAALKPYAAERCIRTSSMIRAILEKYIADSGSIPLLEDVEDTEVRVTRSKFLTEMTEQMKAMRELAPDIV